MKLMMFVGNDLIEAVTINPTDLRVPGYLGKFKRSLKSKYAELIQTSSADPEFLVSEREIPPPQKKLHHFHRTLYKGGKISSF